MLLHEVRITVLNSDRYSVRHAHDTQAERKILQEAETEWVSARRLAVAAALESLLIARENLPRGLAEDKARKIAARVTFLVIYPGLLYHPKCIRMFGQQINYLVRQIWLHF